MGTLATQQATLERTRPSTVEPHPRAADAALAERLVQQDQEALSDAYHLYGTRVYRVAYGLLRRE